MIKQKQWLFFAIQGFQRIPATPQTLSMPRLNLERAKIHALILFDDVLFQKTSIDVVINQGPVSQ